MEHSLDSIVLLDKDYNFIQVSETYARSCQRDSSEFPGHNHFEFYPSPLREEFDAAAKEKKIYKRKARPFIFPDHPDWGTTYWDLALVPILDSNQDIQFFLLTLKDVTEEILSQQKIESALQEKEVLLRELYHRTKNNMQVIRSMLNLQASNMEDNEQVQKLVKDVQNRIMAMSLVQQKLYESHDLSRIPMQHFLQELAGLIFQSQAVPKQEISLQVESEDIYLMLDTAIPCALLLNELLTNSLKYAFPHNRAGNITIRMYRVDSSHVKLEYSDDGVGFPPDLDVRQETTLGLSTVFAIAEKQMKGKVTFASQEGVTWTVEFPESLFTPRV